jgi:hypothetical protein
MVNDLEGLAIPVPLCHAGIEVILKTEVCGFGLARVRGLLPVLALVALLSPSGFSGTISLQ